MNGRRITLLSHPWPWILVRLMIMALALAAGGATSCSFGTGDVEPPPASITFRFGMHGDATGEMDFHAMTNDPQTVADARAQLALPVAERRLFISGPIERGSGAHNEPWHWHFVPHAWSLTEAAIELCDGNAVLVDQAVDYWVDTVGSFCPWGSYVAAELEP